LYGALSFRRLQQVSRKGSSIFVCDQRFLLDIYSRLEDNGEKRGCLGLEITEEEKRQ
jgi:hypothetical protein